MGCKFNSLFTNLTLCDKIDDANDAYPNDNRWSTSRSYCTLHISSEFRKSVAVDKCRTLCLHV